MIASISGRLVRPYINSNYYRWMGVRCCDVQVLGPRESDNGAVQRPYRATRRGKRRRGIRSRERRKVERALVRAARPKPLHVNHVGIPIITQNGTNRRFRLENRKDAYSLALCRKFISHNDKLEKFRAKFNPRVTRNEAHTVIYNTICSRIKLLRRSWLQLAKARYPDESPQFRILKFQLLTGGLKIESNLNWKTIDGAEQTTRYMNDDGETRFHCTTCNRDTVLKVCRLCGKVLAPPSRRSALRRGPNRKFR